MLPSDLHLFTSSFNNLIGLIAVRINDLRYIKFNNQSNRSQHFLNRSIIYVAPLSEGAHWRCRLGCEHDTLRLLLLRPQAGTQPIRPTCTIFFEVEEETMFLFFLRYNVTSSLPIVDQHSPDGLFPDAINFRRCLFQSVAEQTSAIFFKKRKLFFNNLIPKFIVSCIWIFCAFCS